MQTIKVLQQKRKPFYSTMYATCAESRETLNHTG